MQAQRSQRQHPMAIPSSVSTGFMVNMSLYAHVPYDAVKDFAPITMVANSPNVLLVNPSVPAKSVKELIELIKAVFFD